MAWLNIKVYRTTHELMEVVPPSDSILYYVVNKTRRVPNKVIRYGNEDGGQENYILTGKSEDQITAEEVIFSIQTMSARRWWFLK